MSDFKMRLRPKKPTKPGPIQLKIGDWVNLEQFDERLEEFRQKYPFVAKKDIHLIVEEADYHNYHIFLYCDGAEQDDYGKRLAVYKAANLEYREWQKKYKRQIEQHRIEQKEKSRVTKLQKSLERLRKEIAEAEAKLG